MADCFPGFVNVKVSLPSTNTGLGVVVGPPGAGGTGISCGLNCSACYPAGAVITLNAVPAPGSFFQSFGGCTAVTGAVCTAGPLPVNMITLMGSHTITATFSRPLLLVSKIGTGAGVVTSNPPGINCGPTCVTHFNVGTAVTLTQSAAAGSDFVSWDPCGSQEQCSVTMSEPHQVLVNFSPWPQITVGKNGSGTVISNPLGIQCPAICTAPFPRKSVLSLAALPAPGAQFLGWGNMPADPRMIMIPNSLHPCSGVASPCTFTVSAAVTIPANFSVPRFPLTVVVSGPGSVISTNIAGINCGTDCTESFNEGTPVLLQATPSMIGRFMGWSGACVSTSFTCSVAMGEAKSVSALFVSTAIQVR